MGKKKGAESIITTSLQSCAENLDDIPKESVTECDGEELNRLFIKSCIFGRTEIAMQILNGGKVDPSLNENEGIVKACLNGHREIAIRLASHPRVDPSAREGWPL